MAIWDSMGNFNAGVQLGSAMDTTNFDSGGSFGDLTRLITDAYSPAGSGLANSVGSQLFGVFENDLDPGVGMPDSYFKESDTSKAPPTEIDSRDSPTFGKPLTGDNAIGALFAVANDAVDIFQGDFSPSGSRIGGYLQDLESKDRYNRLAKMLGGDSRSMKDKDGKMRTSIEDFARRNPFDLKESVLGGLNDNFQTAYPGSIVPGITFRY